MTDAHLADRRVAYDGLDAQAAATAASQAACPRCHGPLALDDATPEDPSLDAAIAPPGVVRHEAIPGSWVFRTEVGGVTSQVVRTSCPACQATCLVAISHDEWQPARWVALEPLVVVIPDPHADQTAADGGATD